MLTFLVFIVVIMLLVLPHELGHFATAKWFGIRVDEFGIGFARRLWSRKFGETEYSLNILPLGGFVKIFGEDDDREDPRSFSGKPFFVKVIVIAAGIAANILIAAALFSVLAYTGTPQFGVEINSVVSGSPAQAAGMRTGDIIASFEGVDEGYFGVQEVQEYINAHKGGVATFVLARDGERVVVDIMPRQEPPQGEGPLGIQIGTREIGTLSVPWYRAPIEGVKRTFMLLALLVQGFIGFFASLFQGGVATEDVAGPVRIGIIARDVLAIGVSDFINFVAFLSLNLAVINILPIPALDGGRIAVLIVEKIIRRPIPSRVMGPIHSTFFLLLIALMLWLTWHEILTLL